LSIIPLIILDLLPSCQSSVKKQSFSAEIRPAFADLRIIIVKSQQMAAKYWSYQQMGTFRRRCCTGGFWQRLAWSDLF